MDTLYFYPNLILSLDCPSVDETTTHPSFRVHFGTHPPLLHSLTLTSLTRACMYLCLVDGHLTSSTRLESACCSLSPSPLLQFRSSPACSWTMNEQVSLPPVLHFSRFLLHSIAGGIFLNYTFGHEPLSTPDAPYCKCLS